MGWAFAARNSTRRTRAVFPRRNIARAHVARQMEVFVLRGPQVERTCRPYNACHSSQQRHQTCYGLDCSSKKVPRLLSYLTRGRVGVSAYHAVCFEPPARTSTRHAWKSPAGTVTGSRPMTFTW